MDISEDTDMQHARTVLDRLISRALMPLINIGISGAIAALLFDFVYGFRLARATVRVPRDR